MSEKEKNTKSVLNVISEVLAQRRRKKYGLCSYELDDMRREAKKKKT